MSSIVREVVLRERDNTLIISEVRNGVLITLLRVTAGAVTKAQLEYYKANIKGKVKQAEADLILKYFYGLDWE